MDRGDFIDLLQATHKDIVELNRTKGHDYAGDDDALSNFKSQAADAGVTPEQVWSIFFGKHLAAIHTYVREGDVQSEPVEGRIQDAILYLYLLLGLVVERRGTQATGSQRAQATPVSDVTTAVAGVSP